ncbi:MAG: hypothetical protein ABI548_12225 [Polyangiaceae bacterium]
MGIYRANALAARLQNGDEVLLTKWCKRSAALHQHSNLARRLMLPVPAQFIIAMGAYAINERMARRVEYLQEEVRVLKEALAGATGKKRINFTADQRRRLAIKGKALTPEEREACCQIVTLESGVEPVQSAAGRSRG